MRLEDDDTFMNESEGEGKGILGYAVLAVCLFTVAVLGIVLFVNRDTLFQKRKTPNAEENGMGQAVESLSSQQKAVDDELSGIISGSTLISDDLDIWEEYESTQPQSQEPELSEDASEETDITKDGSHTLVVHADGTEEWISVSRYLPQNEYDYTGLVSRDNRMTYYVEQKLSSYMGIDISKYQGYVDFNEVKKDGIDFVMIRLGARGYSSGQLMLDECYADNIKRATDAGLNVGVYFFSQAITEEEALEEAEMVIEYLADYEITYPVAFDMESIDNDTSRIDALTKEERTRIARTFVGKIRESGYNAVIYGDKEWVLTKINYAALTDLDIWLAQESDVPDYPYRFTMWQYSTQGKVEGVSGNVDLNISFIDYSIK